LVVACGGGDPEAQPSAPEPTSPSTDDADAAEGPAPTDAATTRADVSFSTGDLDTMVLGQDDAPSGMKAGAASLETAYGSGSLDDNAKAAGYGLLMVWSRTFSTPSSLKGAEVPDVGAQGFFTMSSSAAVYENAQGAAAHFGDPSPPPEGVQDYEIGLLNEPLGDQARQVRWRASRPDGGTAPYFRVSWRSGNALMALEGYGVTDSIDDAVVLALAQQINAGVSSGAPALELPEFTGRGKTVLNDTFDDPKSGWKAEAYTYAAATYDDGTWAMATAEDGYSRPASGIKSVAKLGDVRITSDVRLDTAKGGVGLTCRHSPKGQYYVASVFTNDTALIGRVTGGKDSAHVPLAEVDGVKLGKGSHKLQLDCVGGELVRVTLRLDGDVIVEGLDTSGAIATGAPGMYIEGLGATAAATYESITISRP
jgi:hypothetical protein